MSEQTERRFTLEQQITMLLKTIEAEANHGRTALFAFMGVAAYGLLGLWSRDAKFRLPFIDFPAGRSTFVAVMSWLVSLLFVYFLVNIENVTVRVKAYFDLMKEVPLAIPAERLLPTGLLMLLVHSGTPVAAQNELRVRLIAQVGAKLVCYLCGPITLLFFWHEALALEQLYVRICTYAATLVCLVFTAMMQMAMGRKPWSWRRTYRSCATALLVSLLSAVLAPLVTLWVVGAVFALFMVVKLATDWWRGVTKEEREAASQAG